VKTSRGKILFGHLGPFSSIPSIPIHSYPFAWLGMSFLPWSDVKCTQSKVTVKFFFVRNLTPFDREFQGGQEYVCLAFFKPFFPVKKLKKVGRYQKQIIRQLSIDSTFLKLCLKIEPSNLVFLIHHRKLRKKLVLNHF
jgi:hypothetical protein